jgi:maltose phosphorylase
LKVTCSHNVKPKLTNNNSKVGYLYELSLKPNETITFRKFVSVVDNRYEKNQKLKQVAITKVNDAYHKGFDVLFNEHVKA